MKRIKRKVISAIFTLVLLSNSKVLYAAELDSDMVEESINIGDKCEVDTQLESLCEDISFDGYDDGGIAESKTSVIYTYGYKKTAGDYKYGAWRNGVSGKGKSTLSLTQTNSTTLNLSFTASVSGSYTHGSTIGSMLGVTLGESKSYGVGAGYSVTVPAGKKYMIIYRPRYRTYTVEETKYMEQYVPGIGHKRWPMSTKTCYVDVFDSWDFSYKEIK